MAKLTEPWPALLKSGLLRPLGAVLGTALFTVGHSQCVERATNDVISDTGKVLHTAPANKHHGVLLQIVPYARDIGSNFHTVCQTDTSDFTQGRVRFFGRRRIDTHTNPAFLGAALKCGSTGFLPNFHPSLPYQLVDCGHYFFKLRYPVDRLKLRHSAGRSAFPAGKSFVFIGTRTQCQA